MSKSYPKDIVDRHMFRHSYDEWDLRFNGLFNSFGSLVSRDIDCGCIGLCPFLGLEVVLVSQLVKLHPPQREVNQSNTHTALTDGKTGNPKCSPSTPGLTPPTILVPHSRDSLTLAVACLPVAGISIPCIPLRDKSRLKQTGIITCKSLE